MKLCFIVAAALVALAAPASADDTDLQTPDRRPCWAHSEYDVRPAWHRRQVDHHVDVKGVFRGIAPGQISLYTYPSCRAGRTVVVHYRPDGSWTAVETI